MRIGLFTDSYLPRTDGIAYSIETFRIELEELGHEVFVIGPAPGLRYREKSPNIIRFPAVKGLVFDDYLTSIFFPPQALQRIKKLKLDIVHFHTPSQIGLLGAYYALHNKLPLVTTYHSDLFEYVTHYPQVLPGAIALSLLSPIITKGRLEDFRVAVSSIKPERNIDKWNQKIIVRGMKMLNNYCDRVIAPSRKIERQLKSWGIKTPIRILPTGVDKITTTNRAVKLFISKYHLSPTDQVILYIGRLGREKNLELLLSAFAILSKTHPRAKLILIGRHDYQEKLEALADQLGIRQKVIFAGVLERQRLGPAYQVAKVFAFPSRTDTQGLVLHEAAAAGVPIVMIDKEITEIVKDGVNGFFARNSKRDFASKLSRILDNAVLREAMGSAGVLLASKHSARAQALELERLYKNVLKGHANAKILPQK